MKITIDLSKWATARQIATEKGWDTSKNCTQRVTNLVNRYEVKTWPIPELGIRLVDRKQFNAILSKQIVSFRNKVYFYSIKGNYADAKNRNMITYNDRNYTDEEIQAMRTSLDLNEELSDMEVLLEYLSYE